MDKKSRIKIWTDGAKRNKRLADDLYKIKHYDWCLFIWHLVLEKQIKAKIIQMGGDVPLIHNLVALCRIVKIRLSDGEKKELSEVNSYNVEARYEEIKQALYKKATKKYTENWVRICEKYYKKFV